MNKSEPQHTVTEPIGSSEVEPRTPLVDSTAECVRLGSWSSNRPRPSVELHIHELVLHGFEPAQRYTIGDAIERELTRLLTDQGAPVAITHDVEIASLNDGVIDVKLGSNGEAVGIELARKIYGGLGQ